MNLCHRFFCRAAILVVVLTILNRATVAQSLPTGWLDGDIGSVGQAGSTTFSNGAFTVNATTGAVGGTSDSFHFVYQSFSGDGSIVARVNSQQGATSPQVGVMM